MILVVGGVKGGIGKSTTAANLAVCAAASGARVVLVDADPQQTTVSWAGARSEKPRANQVTTVAIVGKHIADELKRLDGSYDLVVVDAGARDTSVQRRALAVADLVLLPFRPRGPDLWTLPQVAETIAEIRTVNPALRACAFINCADPSGRDNDEAAAAFAAFSGTLDAAPIRVGNRKPFSAAHLDGLGLIEMRPLPFEAHREIMDLYRYVVGALNAPPQHEKNTVEVSK